MQTAEVLVCVNSNVQSHRSYDVITMENSNNVDTPTAQNRTFVSYLQTVGMFSLKARNACIKCVCVCDYHSLVVEKF